jgi:hypothetical protein
VLELQEVHEIIEGARHDPVEKEVIENAIQVMLTHQIIYADTSTVRREIYDLLRREHIFFERFFNAMGVRFAVDQRTSMISLSMTNSARFYGVRLNRRKKDETIVMLALRLAYDDGLRAGTVDDTGRIPSDTDELFDRIRTIGNCEPPTEARLAEILKELRRRGGILVETPDKLDHITPLTVLPGITILVDDVFVAGVTVWAEAGAPGDVFEYLAGRHAANEDEPAPVNSNIEEAI